MGHEQTPLQRVAADFGESQLALAGLAMLLVILLIALFARPVEAGQGVRRFTQCSVDGALVADE